MQSENKLPIDHVTVAGSAVSQKRIFVAARINLIRQLPLSESAISL
jgi:hypothetical protein